MLYQIDGIPFSLRRPADLGFLRPYGRCFRIWDRGPSGNICFGMEGQYGKLFVKYSGAKPVRSQCRPGEAEETLKRMGTGQKQFYCPDCSESFWEDPTEDEECFQRWHYHIWYGECPRCGKQIVQNDRYWR